jgi:hypothetical protein
VLLSIRARQFFLKLIVLTFMATIEEAIAQGYLDLFELPDGDERLPVRPLYVTQAFLDFADNTNAMHEMKFGAGGRTIFEHLLQALCEFRCGTRPAGAGDLRRMMPTKHGIWSFHTVGLRTYGWCPAPHAFVVITSALEMDTKINKGLNDAKRAEVLAFAKAHGLAETIKLGDLLALFPHQA